MSSPLLLIFVVTAFWIFSVVTPYQTGMQKRMTDPVTICTVFPPRVNSLGLWNKSDAWPVHVKDPLGIVHFTFRLQNYTLPILEFEITLIYVLTQLTHLFLKLFGLPVFAAQLLAGLLLGDLGLDRMVRHSSRGFSLNPIFPFPNQEVLNIISLSGYTLFTFLFGVKMDVGLVYKTGRKAIYTGVLTLIVPLIAATATLLILTFQWSLQAEEIVQLLFITSLHSLSPSPVIHCLLTELRILNSELGRLALSSALVSDVSSISLTDPDKPLIDLTMMIVFTLFVYYVCRPVMLWMVRKTPEGKSVKDSYILIILLAVFGSGLISHAARLSIVVGPLILGLAVPDGPPLGATLVRKLDFMVNRVFMPVFVTTSMMRVVVHQEVPDGDQTAVRATAIITLDLLEQICGLFGDSFVIVHGVFNYMMFTVVFSAIVVPPLVKLLYDPKIKYAGYQQRNLMNDKPNSDLRILACINRADNTPAIINLLDAACPTRESSITLYVLHLIELVARSTPIFFAHDIHKRDLSNYSYSDNVIRSFTQFMRDNDGAVSVNVFTAVSPPQYMYDDICTLALDKDTSLIILPFHRKWSTTDGSIESENQNVRDLNRRVLKIAPCSVAILVNRGHIRCTNSSGYRVAVVFLGGKDDREALTFVKRMVKDACISLTVIHLVDASDHEESHNKWEWVQDNEMLKEVKQKSIGYVSYVEENVQDGTQTTRKIRSLMDDDEYDLFIVGRRYKVKSPQTLGLEDWSEFPELGVIGDMLSSADFRCKSSVLVVQQQQQRRR
ncbi:unnamed protein product [Malus baccata var. baccata]